MPNFARSVPKPLKVPSLARSVPKPLKVPSLASSVHKPLKVPSPARSVPKPLKVPRCRPPPPAAKEQSDWLILKFLTQTFYHRCLTKYLIILTLNMKLDLGVDFLHDLFR